MEQYISYCPGDLLMTQSHDYYKNTDRPQTEKKLSILRKYFDIWLKIWSGPSCSSWVNKEWYVIDLFAGTGEASGTGGIVISGSPLIMLEELEKNSSRLKRIGITVNFILV
jgi:three-Cys-motif partner protein